MTTHRVTISAITPRGVEPQYYGTFARKSDASDYADPVMSKSTHYEVTVWDVSDGDILKKLWDATADELEELYERYDEPWHDVVIDREWEAEDDE